TSETGGRRKRRTILWVAVALGAVIALFVAVLATRHPAANQVVPTPLAGKAAPDIDGQTIVSPNGAGGRFRLSDQQGKFTLVNFFATWCGPCHQEHPELVKFARDHASQGDVQVVSVVYGDTAKAVRQFFVENGGNWPVVDDPGDRTSLDYG